MRLGQILFISIYISLPFSIYAKQENKSGVIKVFSWWNYIDSRVSSKIKKEGFDTDISIYKSNEVALARLLSNKDGFDVAIISNTNLDLLLKTKVLDQKILQDLTNKREYLEALALSKACVPYLWGTTLFAYDGRSANKGPKTLSDLIDLKKEGFTLGLLDEPLEMAARIVGDGIDNCPIKDFSNIFGSITSCEHVSLKKNKLNFSSKDFLTAYDEFLKKEKVATYGWQGSVFLNLKSAPWIKFNIAEKHPVIGLDYVCILGNRPKNSVSEFKLKKFVETLTDKESTHLNVQSMQYFSPYKNDQVGLSPEVAKIYNQITDNFKTNKPIFIRAPEAQALDEVNKWWKSIRYKSE